MSYYHVLKSNGSIEKVDFKDDVQEEELMKQQTLYEARIFFFTKPVRLWTEKIDGWEQALETSDSEAGFERMKKAILRKLTEELFLDQLNEEEVYPILDKTRIDFYQYFQQLKTKTWNDYGSSVA